MKREFLTKLLPDAPKEVIDQIMNENGNDIEAQKNTISTLTTERDGLKTQLDTARSEIQSYKDMDIDGIKAKAADWEAKYNADTQKLKDDLAAAEYGHTVKDAVASLKFSSESAKKAFVADLTAKKLPVQEGKMLGFEDYVKSYRESDPGAFLPEDGKMPVFVRGGGNQTPPGGDNPFHFHFTGVRASGTENK